MDIEWDGTDVECCDIGSPSGSTTDIISRSVLDTTIYNLRRRINMIEDRLIILSEKDDAQLETYSSLEDIYTQYKTLEALLHGDENY
jgi:hypothetical protein